MNNFKKIDSDTLLSAAVSFTVVCVFCACIAGFYNEIVYQRILLGYCDILVFATMGVLFCNGMYFANKRYFAYVTFLCWVAVTFMLRGEFDLTMSVNRSHFVILCASCGVLLPMPAILKGNKKKNTVGFCSVFGFVADVCISDIGLYWSYQRGKPGVISR